MGTILTSMTKMADENGWIGVVGPFPERRSSSSNASDSLDSSASRSSMALAMLSGTTAALDFVSFVLNLHTGV